MSLAWRFIVGILLSSGEALKTNYVVPERSRPAPNVEVILSSNFRFTDGIISGLLRLGISEGEFIAYVEVADSGVGFKYTVSHAGTYISGGQAPDLPTAKRMAEKELRILSSGIKN